MPKKRTGNNKDRKVPKKKDSHRRAKPPVLVRPVILLDARGGDTGTKDPVARAAEFLRRGSFVAVCGHDSFLVACSALKKKALTELRKRTRKPSEPFILVSSTSVEVEKYCFLDDVENTALASPQRPVVLLRCRPSEIVTDSVAPGLAEYAVSLPAGLLGELLAESRLEAVAVTRTEFHAPSEKPAVKLAGTVDYFLVNENQRKAVNSDSVVKVMAGKPVILRRGRDSDPRLPALPLETGKGPEIVALGTDYDNTVCAIEGNETWMSSQLDRLKDAQDFDGFRQNIKKLKKIAGIVLPVVAHDSDKRCLSTRYAGKLKAVELVPVEHHLAHVAGCMAENGETGPVIGVVYEDACTGDDGTFWGAEFLDVSRNQCRRLGHLRNIRWPGGIRASREPWRIAMAFIYLSYGYQTAEISRELFTSIPADKPRIVFEMLEKGLHSPFGSSMGAFLDAVAAITGICKFNSYPRQAARMLEAAAGKNIDESTVRSYPYDIIDDGSLMLVDPTRTFYELVENVLAKKEPARVAARAMRTVVDFTTDVCRRIRERTGTAKVALTGEAFESRLLLEGVKDGLERDGFDVLAHTLVPPGDASVSLGQAYVARAAKAAVNDERETSDIP
jgi:hydrogenase maturation protein HypF